ncbi:MAG: hypothetical protein E6I32_08605 [Chloroflexi bacterium]|nr:MAG: hypothetical protein E6I32_08605 [Chloroflexota bacterium]
MIILKHLKVKRFRLLRDVDLYFPQRGSILISGPNEAGKSTIFESIYFALYGEPLTIAYGKRAVPSLNELIHYGEKHAVITLALAIGATDMTITRTINREEEQTIALDVRKLGMPEEKTITDLKAANERIISELGRIDGKTLRNSCFVEQKGLSRLENLSGREREATLHNLLGLEKLSRLADHFRLTDEDERLMTECTERLKLAEVQARIPVLSQKLGELEAALDAVTISEDLAAISRQEAEIHGQQEVFADIEAKRLELKGRQNRIVQFKKADAILNNIIVAYDVIADAQRELPELEHQLAELERREKEELPALEQRVRSLAELTRSFGTLERMATDLLQAVNTIKELELGLKQQEHLQEILADLEEQIAHTLLLVEDAQQSQHQLEEQHRTTRPQLEARLKRLQSLAQKLTALREAEGAYSRRVAQRQQAEENAAQIEKLRKELQDNEQELALVEKEARQVQERADATETRWRQLSIRRQLQEWQRLKGLSQGLVEAEEHVRAAHQQQEQLTLAALSARRAAAMQMGIFIACAVIAALCGGAALFEVFRHSYIFATILGMIAIVLGAVGGVNLQSYGKTREKERDADQRMQEAINRVGMMVAARETAMRIGGSQEALAKVEHEIQSLGGNVPHSVDEVQYLLQHAPSAEESLADVQQQMTESRNQALAARDQLNVTMEALAALSTKKASLQEQRKQEDWDNLDAKLQVDTRAIEQLQNELILAAGQEGLPIPAFAKSFPSSPAAAEARSIAPVSELQTKLDETIKATEYEIAALDGKMGTISDISSKVRIHQDALDALLARKQTLTERYELFQASNPMRQIERAREQQIALREALRSLQDSLRQRVLPLGVSFGQTAINTADATSRKQLDSLQIALGRKEELQNRHALQAALLKEHQESLSEYYRQLSKFSSTLGSWIVPPNPFADALRALRQRCEREMQEANEAGILGEIQNLNIQESASRTKIELCQHEIEQAHERMATMLAQRNRPPAKGYTLPDIAAVWPLVSEYSPQDRARLEEEISTVAQELRQLEQQDLALSERLETGKVTLNLEQTTRRMAQQERSYQTKERAGLLIAATCDRLMRKMLPRTEYYMQQLLPLLTRGRYHDARLTTEPEEHISSGGPLQVSVWEPAANAYIPQPAMSGGTADQVSLVLRLAFAIAALPRELGAAPGFLLLDEPLSVANNDRMQSLVNVVTGDTLGQHFEQIFFVSHNTTFDSSRFLYNIYIDGGLVVESNLPVEVVETPSVPSQLEGSTNNHASGFDPSTNKQEMVSLETVSNTP